MAYDNTNTGMLAKNERMREGKKDPEYTGTVNVNGQEFWLKAWVREGKEGSKMEGKKFFSLAFDPKDAPASAPAPRERPPARQPAARQPAPPQYDDMDDDIPF